MKPVIYLIFLAVLTIASCKKDSVINQTSATAAEAQKALSGTINVTLKDNNNVLWTGTNTGLIRGTGKDAILYTPTNSVLISGTIQALALGINNTIWIGTDKGLIKYTGTNWFVYTTDNGMLTNDNVKAISFDVLKNTALVKLVNNEVVKINN